MGDVMRYRKEGGFDQYLYHQVGETITSSNGVQGKVINEISSGEQFHSSLPFYSNTSEVYFKRDDQGDFIEQARIYRDRKVALDVDWNHTHMNRDGSVFPQGTIHIHEWREGKNGKWIRGRDARYMNEAELNRYGDLLSRAFPKEVKFVP